MGKTMIDREVFNAMIQEAGLLITGRKIPEEFATAVFRKTANWFATSDFQKAFDSLTDQDGVRLTYPAIYKHLVRHRSVRLEEEAIREKRIDRASADNMSKTNPPLYAMMEAVLSGNKEALKEYSLDREYPVCNAILIRKSGEYQRIIIDDKQEGFAEAVNIIRVPAGDGTARQMELNVAAAKFIIIDQDRAAPNDPMDVFVSHKVEDDDDLDDFL